MVLIFVSLYLGYLFQPHSFCQMASRKSYLLAHEPEKMKTEARKASSLVACPAGTADDVLA